MRYYYDKLNNLVFIVDNFNYRVRENQDFEMTAEQYNEYDLKTTIEGYDANFECITEENENKKYNKVSKITYSVNSVLQQEHIKNNYILELSNIQNWLKDNDWKINKIVVGEWTTDDERWQEYLNERAIKRARQDELLLIINA